MYFRIDCLKLLVIRKGFFLFTVVLYDNILVVFIRGLLLDRIDTPFQIIDMIFVWNDNAD